MSMSSWRFDVESYSDIKQCLHTMERAVGNSIVQGIPTQGVNRIDDFQYGLCFTGEYIFKEGLQSFAVVCLNEGMKLFTC